MLECQISVNVFGHLRVWVGIQESRLSVIVFGHLLSVNALVEFSDQI